jgi:archaemetzincin
MGQIDSPVLREVSSVVGETFRRQVRILDRAEEPDYAMDPVRGQWLSISILKRILEHADEGTEKILGIVNVDIFVPVLRFLFGQAQLSGKAALISLCRLRQEFYELPEDRELLVARARKEAVHELGHAYALVHCRNPKCVMHYSNSLREVDARPLQFCGSCLDLLNDKLKTGE